MDNNELDEILASIKNRGQSVNEIINALPDPEPLEPPKPKVTSPAAEPTVKANAEKSEPVQPVAPKTKAVEKQKSAPVPKSEETESIHFHLQIENEKPMPAPPIQKAKKAPKPPKPEKPKKEKKAKHEKPHKEKTAKPKIEKPPKVKKEKVSKPKAEKIPKPKKEKVAKPTKERVSKPKKEKAPKPKKEKLQRQKKERAKKAVKQKVKRTAKQQLKIVLIIIGAIILAAAAVIGAIKYSQTAYLRPYEEKYGIEYPKGILEQFCDRYGKDQTTVGTIYSPDLKKGEYIVSKAQANCGIIESGTSITKEQQFKAIKLTDNMKQLEELYNNAEGYILGSQTIEFTSLYKRETYQIVGAYYNNTNPKDDNGYVFRYNLSGDLTQGSFAQYRDRVMAKALYKSGDNIGYKNNYLTLSIDSTVHPGWVFVLLCKKTEEPVTKYDKATVNEKPFYPQAYYDEQNTDNPYKFTAKWYPILYTDEKHEKTTVLTTAENTTATTTAKKRKKEKSSATVKNPKKTKVSATAANQQKRTERCSVLF